MVISSYELQNFSNCKSNKDLLFSTLVEFFLVSAKNVSILSISDACLVIIFLFSSANELMKSLIISIWESLLISEFFEFNEIKAFNIGRAFFLYNDIDFFSLSIVGY